MTGDPPDWETAARHAVSGEIREDLDRFEDDCLRVVERLENDAQVRESDVQRLRMRLDEWNYFLENVLAPITVDTNEAE